MVPRQGKVVQTVREKFSCRACEAITQPPAPHHAIARGRAGPGLLAMIVCDKFAMHLPLTRQSRAMAAEGIEIDVSTLADWVGAACVTLRPLHDAIRTPVLAAERLHGDDTTVPVLARKKTVTGRIWTYVRDVSPANATGPREHGETLRRQRPAGGTLPLRPRPWRHSPPGPPGRVERDTPGRRLCRLQRPLCDGTRAGAAHRGLMLGPRRCQVLRAGRSRQGHAGADGHRGGAAHRWQSAPSVVLAGCVPISRPPPKSSCGWTAFSSQLHYRLDCILAMPGCGWTAFSSQLHSTILMDHHS